MRADTRNVVAHLDHPYLLEWLLNASTHAGSFLRALAGAALLADDENWPVLRPVILHMRAKYPEYEPTTRAKEELAIAVKKYEANG